MELGTDDMPCKCGFEKICKNCEFGTRDYNTSKHYCLNVSGLRICLFGPRRVSPTDTCNAFMWRSKFGGQSR